MAEAHIRLTCPCCNMVMAPSRLDQDFGVRFATVRFQGRGRGHGSCHWDWDAEIPDRQLLLLSLRAKLERCLDAVEEEIGEFPLPREDLLVLVRPVPMVQVHPMRELRQRVMASLSTRVNPILQELNNGR